MANFYIGIKQTKIWSSATPTYLVSTGYSSTGCAIGSKGGSVIKKAAYYNWYNVTGTNFDESWFTNTSTNRVFVHEVADASITQISQLPIGESYISYDSSSTYNGKNIYLFNITYTPNPANQWVSGSNYVGGDTKYHYYRITSGSVSSTAPYYVGQNSDTQIVELYHNSNGISNTTGLYIRLGSSSGDKEVYNITANQQQHPNVVLPQSVGGSTGLVRRVFAIHNVARDTTTHGVTYTGSTSAALSNTNYTVTSFGESSAQGLHWAEHTAGDGNKYFAITVYSNNQFVCANVFTASVGKSYRFTLHTYSDANNDGIIIATSSLTSSANFTSSGIARCSGVNANTTYTLTPSDSVPIFIYYKTNNDGSMAYAERIYDYDSQGQQTGYHYAYLSLGSVSVEIKDVYTVTFNKNGGTGGTNSMDVTGGELGAVIPSLPYRNGVSSGCPNFIFKGYYGDSYPYGGTQYFDANGHQVTAISGNITVYARWENDISYALSGQGPYGYLDYYVYCTDQAVAQSSTTSTVLMPLANNPWKTSSNENIAGFVIRTVSGTRYNWGISNNGTQFSIPSGAAAGAFTISLELVSCEGSNYAEKTIYRTFDLTLLATTLTYGNVTLNVNVNSSLSSYPYLPASSFTLGSLSNLTTYFTPSASQTVSCNNGASRAGSVTIYWQGLVPNGNKTITVPSLGTTYSTSAVANTVSLGSSDIIVVAEGEGGKTTSSTTLSPGWLYRQPNVITSLTIQAVDNPITYGGSTYMHVIAQYTSGSTTDVVDDSGLSLSTNPSNVINITSE